MNKLTKYGPLSTTPNAYGIQISTQCYYIKYYNLAIRGNRISNLTLSKSKLDILDLYLDFKKNSFKVCKNGYLINYNKSLKKKIRIVKGLYRFGFASSVKGNEIVMLEYDYQKIKL